MSVVKLAARGLAILLTPPFVLYGLDRSPAISVDKFELLTPLVARGGSLKIRYHVTFYRRCSGEAWRYIQDSSGKPKDTAVYRFRDGIGRDGQPIPLDNPAWVPVEATVPDTLNPGPALYQNVTDFYCNPLQRFLQSWFHISFAYPLVHFTILSERVDSPAPPITAFRPEEDGATNLRDRANTLVPAGTPDFSAKQP